MIWRETLQAKRSRSVEVVEVQIDMSLNYGRRYSFLPYSKRLSSTCGSNHHIPISHQQRKQDWLQIPEEFYPFFRIIYLRCTM
jgi:hypothetical protein